MAEWRVVERTVQTLVRLLEQRVNQAGIIGLTVLPVTTVSFKALASSTSPVITLFLYQVTENSELRNAPQRVSHDGQRRRQPLVLELCYLVTPWGSRRSESIGDDSLASLEEARLLGLIFQAFYDHAEVGTADLFEDPSVPVWRAGDNLQIILESLPVEDHYRIWDSSELAYRLSLTYRVRVVHLDSAEDQLAPPVVESTFEGAP